MHNRITSRHRQGTTRPPNKREGDTVRAQGPAQERVPRMPREGDESPDPLLRDEPSAQRQDSIARDDIERGPVDTDKGLPLRETYEKRREDRPDGERKFSP